MPRSALSRDPLRRVTGCKNIVIDFRPPAFDNAGKDLGHNAIRRTATRSQSV
jgi:hypothetical protein